ncbi:UNVERIFIED_CONTAM: putative polygalacturonase [Sesamum calycinum]|uniref:Polygalacturonase n=1 Tax=Sesamum calycinum TaxID=2727403 RepID=A0AAW2NWT1_9LAMI
MGGQVVVVVVAAVVMVLMSGGECRKGSGRVSFEYSAISCRAHSASITDFGGVGDGKTLNTKAFQEAVQQLSRFASDGGAQLFVPAGKWLTAAFNLTSHFTLYLHKDAVLLASQGGVWWQQFSQEKLKYTRPYLIEIMHSDNVQISNLTLLNSHHGISILFIAGITILAPVTSPNTDGINPVYMYRVKYWSLYNYRNAPLRSVKLLKAPYKFLHKHRIEDNYIVSGDDCIAVKSGWDEYGIKYGMPTKHLIIRRLTCISPYSAAIALGSEMSGGIQDVRAQDITAIHTESAVRIKTAVGRGGYVKDIYVKGMNLHTMKWVFWMTGNYGSHADDHYDPNALPEINGMAKKAKKYPWSCLEVEGVSSGVVPQPCGLADQGEEKLGMCDFPTESLAVDGIQLQKCSYRMKYNV